MRYQFFAYTELDIQGFEEAVDELQERVPELAAGLALSQARQGRQNVAHGDSRGKA